MRSTTRVLASCLVGASFALPATDATAAPKRISGKLNKPGYTVIAVGTSGQKAVRAGRGGFKLRPPVGSFGGRQGVSLHLRAPNGTYAGPIVVGGRKKGKRAVLGIRPGVRLGRIRVRRGYATVARRLRRKWVDPSLVARARKGVPIGARLFGRVRSRPRRNPVPGDSDFDGVPDPLDIDDDGDLILDDLDRSPSARAAQQVLEDPMFHNSLELSLSDTVNANAGSTDREIEQTFLGLLFIGRSNAPSTELDCGRDDPGTPAQEGLSYCRPGGNGRIVRGPGQPPVAFPDCCDADGDGFGELVSTIAPPFAGGGSQFFTLRYAATTAEIKTGQVMIKRANDANGAEIATFSKTLQYVFATVPALVSYSDGAGHSGNVSYPVAAGDPPGQPGGQPGGPGTITNAFPVAPRPQGDPFAGQVLVTLTLWQPQRRPITGESGYTDPPSAWTDIGGLTYSATVETPQTPNRVCSPTRTVPRTPTPPIRRSRCRHPQPVPGWRRRSPIAPRAPTTSSLTPST